MKVAWPNRLKVWGETWTAPLTIVSVDDIDGTIENELMESERQLKKQKKPKGSAKAAAKASAGPSGSSQKSNVIEIDEDDIMSIPSEDEMMVVGRPAKVPKTDGSKKAENAAANAEKKAAREKATLWRKEIQKAGKVTQALTSVCQALENASLKLAKNPGSVPDDLCAGLKEAFEKNLTAKKSNSTEVEVCCVHVFLEVSLKRCVPLRHCLKRLPPYNCYSLMDFLDVNEI